jgi:PAS domain S-box-containing protein
MNRYEALFELSPIAQEEYDAAGNMVRMNQAALDLFGVDDEDEYPKMNLFRNPHLPPGFGERLRNGSPVSWELDYDFDKILYRSSRRGTTSLHATIFPIPDEDGRPAGYLLQTLDISEQARSSRALSESADLHRSFIENLDAGWILFDESMMIVEYRDTPSRLMGGTAEKVLGRKLHELRPSITRNENEMTAAFLSILRTGHPVKLQQQALPALDGSPSTRFIDVTAFRVVLGGRPHVACLITDVSRRQKLQEQLVQAQKMESIARLASSIAHDFNNLLSAVLGNASMIELQPDDPAEVKRSAAEIKEAAQRAADLTASMLSFSRKKGPSREPLHVDEAIRDVIALLERAKSPGIEIKTDLPLALPEIEADRAQIESVIMNLMVNAVDAMPGGGTIGISASVLDIDRWRPGTNPAMGTGRWVRLTISDTGCGMDTQTSMRAFEPFFTTKSSGKGTGLGLYSVYGIVQGHGGQINLSSEPGEGTTFDIYFPVLEQKRRRKRLKSMGAPLHGHGTILIVDDEKIICQTLANMLSRLGYSTITAGGGREALEHLGEGGNGIDLVLLDVVMQDMDGAETFREIRKMKDPPHVLLMSGQTQQVNVEHLIQEGARGFLSKPFTLRGLSRKIRFALQG